MNTYHYYEAKIKSSHHRNIEAAISLGNERFNPTLRSPDYLILKERRKLFSKWLENYVKDNKKLSILDIGGRIQPYRPLFKDHVHTYIAVDPQFEGLLDIVAYGENLPIKSDCFDVVLCTQVLSYAKKPHQMVSEIYRVLKKDGLLLLSAPSVFPQHHNERWRFLPDGLKQLLSQFSDVEVEPEGGSITGILRTLNVCLSSYINNEHLQHFFSNTLIPMSNLTGSALRNIHFGGDHFTANYCACAIK